jgi:hypothetical protein
MESFCSRSDAEVLEQIITDNETIKIQKRQMCVLKPVFVNYKSHVPVWLILLCILNRAAMSW